MRGCAQRSRRMRQEVNHPTRRDAQCRAEQAHLPIEVRLCMGHRDEHHGVLVTVGTTKFDELVAAASTAAFAQRLSQLGYRWLRVQVWTSFASMTRVQRPTGYVQVGTGAEPDFQGKELLECTWFQLTCARSRRWRQRRSFAGRTCHQR